MPEVLFIKTLLAKQLADWAHKQSASTWTIEIFLTEQLLWKSRHLFSNNKSLLPKSNIMITYAQYFERPRFDP